MPDAPTAKDLSLYEQLAGFEIIAGPEFFVSMGRVYLAILVKSPNGYYAPLFRPDHLFHSGCDDGMDRLRCARGLRHSGGTTGAKWADLLEGLGE